MYDIKDLSTVKYELLHNETLSHKSLSILMDILGVYEHDNGLMVPTPGSHDYDIKSFELTTGKYLSKVLLGFANHLLSFSVSPGYSYHKVSLWVSLDDIKTMDSDWGASILTEVIVECQYGSSNYLARDLFNLTKSKFFVDVKRILFVTITGSVMVYVDEGYSDNVLEVFVVEKRGEKGE